MKTTRQRLLEILAERRSATTEDLSRSLHVTPANVRHHLSILIKEELVKIVGQRPVHGRGRPVQLYSLSSHVLRHNLDGLASAMLNVVKEISDSSGTSERLRDISKVLAGTSSSTESQSQKLSAAVRRLNEMNYQARWEARVQGPNVILSHCPYAAILSEHPELCLMDKYLMESLTGKETHQVSRLERNAQGIPQCVFALAR